MLVKKKNLILVCLTIIFLISLSSGVFALNLLDSFEDGDSNSNPTWGVIIPSLGGLGVEAAAKHDGTYGFRLGNASNAGKAVYEIPAPYIDANGFEITWWQNNITTAANHGLILVFDDANAGYSTNGIYANMEATNAHLTTWRNSIDVDSGTIYSYAGSTWYKSRLYIDINGLKVSYKLYGADGVTLLGEAYQNSPYGQIKKIYLNMERTTYIDTIYWSGNAFSTTVGIDSNFIHTNQPSQSKILFTDTTTDINISAHVILDDWNWSINGVKESDDQNFYYSTQANQDLNVCLGSSGLYDGNRYTGYYCNPHVYSWDTISPTIDANVANSAYGFTSDFNLNYNMTCFDNFTPIHYLITWNDGTTTTTIYDASYANATLKSGDLDLNVGQSAVMTFTCTDDSNNTATYTTNRVYALLFRLVNENTGNPFDMNKVTAAQAFTYDGNFIYNFKDTNTISSNFFSPTTTIRFDFTYPDEEATKISREINFGYIDDENVGICVAEYQQFYLYRFLSTSVKPVVVYNDFAKCYNLASTTKFLYNTYQSNTAYTINKPYYLYTYTNGVKSLLALLDGANNTEINLDILAFNQQDYVYNVNTDVITFRPDQSDLNTIIFYFSSPNNNDSVTLQIYNGATLLWTYTELTDTNGFQVNFYYGDLNVTDTNLLKVLVTVVNDGETTSFYKYFNTKAKVYSGMLNPIVAIVMSFFVLFFGITMVSYRFAMGWFGLIISFIAIGILALAPLYDYIVFLMAIYFIIGIFIGIIGKEQTLGVSN